jgi:hypothetical protein
LRSSAIQDHVGLSRISEREDGAYSRLQFTAIDKRCNLAQTIGCDVYQEECRGDAMLFGSILIGLGHRRNQLPAPAQNLKGTCLRFASNEVEYCVRIPYLIFKPLRVVVHHLVSTKAPHIIDVFRACRDYGAQVSPTSELNGERADVPGSSVDDHHLTSFEASVVE